jgi:hypothetical protein
MRGRGILGVLVGLAGCGGGELPGSYWDIEVVEATDLCNAEPKQYSGPSSMAYRLQYEGSAVVLNLEDQAFASGTISGCDIAYQSVVWPDTIDGFAVKWQLTGEAVHRAGETGCNLDGVDWQGTETFEIISDPDDHPELEPGCTYSIALEGTFVGTIVD